MNDIHNDNIRDKINAGESTMIPQHIVAVGTAAGKLQALQDFFAPLPSDTGLTFIVIQHLAPNFSAPLKDIESHNFFEHPHRSVTNELLAQHTEMKIFEASDGETLKPNSIYLVPLAKTLVFENGKLHLISQQKKDDRHNLPIDILFDSLATWCGEQAIGVILSGSGSDGAQGIRSIKEAGGLAIAQEEESANFDSMPNNAIATGCIDVILPPSDMADTISRYVEHPFTGADRHKDLLLKETSNLKQIYYLLKRKQNIDFSKYKITTAGRRITRRMSILGINDVSDYIERLRTSDEESTQLITDMLIGVTRFFRDPNAWMSLKKILPKIFEPKRESNESIRIWVPGCSTGEEAYTVSILVREVLDEMEIDLPVKIFATDLNQLAIDKASSGKYSKSIADNLREDQVSRFFRDVHDRYEVSPQLRKSILFAKHDVLRDAPFTKLDLISCRNLLIYIQPEAQARIIALFHHALSPKGYLLLGSSETVGELGGKSGALTPLDDRQKLYAKNPKVHLPLPVGVKTGELSLPLHRPTMMRNQGLDSIASKALNRAYQFMVNSFGPPAVLLSTDHNVIYTFGDLTDYLKIPQGNYSSQIEQLVSSDLKIALLGALTRAEKTRKTVSFRDIKIQSASMQKTVELAVEPLQGESHDEPLLFFVFFKESRSVDLPVEGLVENFSIDNEKNKRIQNLEINLRQLRENLQATVEELETSNEELQATNEELIASNEELQSTNEELHSVNEELFSVNSEHQAKIRELTDLTNDHDNLMANTKIGVVFVDANLNVRKFTPAAQAAINLQEIDIGRPLHHITHELGELDLIKHVKKTMSDKTVFSKELRTTDGMWFLFKVHPFLTEDSVVDGAVITVVDIHALERSRSHLSAIIDNSPVGIQLLDLKRCSVLMNKMGAETLDVHDPATIQGKNIYTVSPKLEAIRHLHDKVYRGESVDIGDMQFEQFPDQYFDTKYRPAKDRMGNIIGLLSIITDISERRKREIETKQHESRSRALLKAVRDVVLRIKKNGTIIDAKLDPKIHNWIEKTPVGKTLVDIWPGDMSKQCEKLLTQTLKKQTLIVKDFELSSGKDDVRIVQTRFSPNGENEAYVIMRDITEERTLTKILEDRSLDLEQEAARHKQTALTLKETQLELEQRYSESSQLFTLSADAIIVINKNGTIRRVNPALTSTLGYKSSEKMTGTKYDRFVYKDDAAIVKSAIQDLEKHGSVVTEFRIQNDNIDGNPHWFSFSAAKTADGTIYVIGRNTSERRAYEEKLSFGEERVRLALSASRSGWWDWHLVDDRLSMSLFCIAHLGYEPSDFSEENGTRVRHDLIHPDDRELVEHAFEKHWQGDSPVVNIEYRALCKGGGYRWIHDHGAVVQRTPNNKPVRMVGTMRDIQKRKRLEELNELNSRELASSNESLQQFAHIAAHDLKAPLRAITNMSCLLEEKIGPGCDKESQKYLELIQSRSTRMGEFLDGLLEYAKVGSGQKKSVEIDVYQRIQQLVEIVAPKQRTSVVVPDNLPKLVTDVTPFDQVMINLLSNAARYSDPDGKIIVETEDDGDRLKICVQDYGPGIPAEFKEKIFKLFETVEARDSGAGTGLGLAIADKAVQSVGGELGVESELGKGATFHFTWPKNIEGRIPFENHTLKITAP